VPLCGHATLAASRVLFSLDRSLQTIQFQTRFSGTLRAKRISDGQNSTKIEIYLPTFSGDVLTASKDSAERALKLVRQHVGVFGLREDQVVGAVEYEFLGKSAIVQLSPEVDLEGLKYDPKDLVSLLSSSHRIIVQAEGLGK
jgi:predicted PhzF superfamily epimerase YddE/YHI9